MNAMPEKEYGDVSEVAPSTQSELLEAARKLNLVSKMYRHIDYFRERSNPIISCAEIDVYHWPKWVKRRRVIFIDGKLKEVQFKLNYMYNFRFPTSKQNKAFAQEKNISARCWKKYFKKQVKTINPMEFPTEFPREFNLMGIETFIQKCLAEPDSDVV